MSISSIATENEEIKSILSEDINTSNVDMTLNELFQHFNPSISSTTLKKNHKAFYPKLKGIIDKFGVKENQLDLLMDLIYSKKLGLEATREMVDLCLPRGPLKSKYIIRIFQCLDLRNITGTPAVRSSQAKVIKHLLKWAIAMYDLIDHPNHIICLYGVLFHYLDVDLLRPEICHLLYFMTNRSHVKQYRTERLLDLLEKSGGEHVLYALMHVYSTYNSRIIYNQTKNYRKAVFKNPMPDVKEKLQEIRDIWENDDLLEISSFNRPKPEITSLPKKAKRLRTDKDKPIEIPTTRSTNQDKNASIIEDIQDVVTLAEKFDRLSLPDQMASILNDRMLQHLIACDPRESCVTRINSWLSDALEILLRERNRTKLFKTSLRELLQKCITMARLTKAHVPIMESFLKDYISKWNGWEFEDEIFELLTFIKPQSFEDLSDSYLKPLYQLYSVSNIQWKAKLILCYTEWLKNWALLDWKRHSERRQTGNESEMDDLIWLFQGLEFNIDYFKTIQHFIYHVDRVCVIGLVMEGDHPLLQHASLSFFEFVSSISIQHDIPEIIIPAAPLIYRSFFSMSGMAVSRICGIIDQYKRAFEENDKKMGDWVTRHTEEYLDNFNTFVMDVCSALWRNSVFARSSEAEYPFSLSPDISNTYSILCESRGESANLVLSLTHSGCLAGFSERFIKEKENEANIQVRHEGPVTAQSLKTLSEADGISISYMEYRIGLLDHLKSLGFNGLYDLLHSCMTSLIERRKNEQMTKME